MANPCRDPGLTASNYFFLSFQFFAHSTVFCLPKGVSDREIWALPTPKKNISFTETIDEREKGEERKILKGCTFLLIWTDYLKINGNWGILLSFTFFSFFWSNSQLLEGIKQRNGWGRWTKARPTHSLRNPQKRNSVLLCAMGSFSAMFSTKSIRALFLRSEILCSFANMRIGDLVYDCVENFIKKS